MPKWGDPTRLWGALDYTYGVDGANPTGEIQWIFQVDWDADNTFNYNEAAYLVDLEVSRGERYFVKPGGNGFEVMRPGEGTATLIDRNGRFDPDNASGPLYGKILPGCKFRLKVKYISSGATYNVMAGFINDIPPVTELDRVQLSLRESTSLLDKNISIPMLYRYSITDAINYVLDRAKWPTIFGRSVDTETQQITALSLDSSNALDTLLDIGAASLGYVFANASGTFTFHSRGQSGMPTVTLDQSQCLKMIRRSQPWENLRNIGEITANKKVKAREAAIWQSGTPITVAASSTLSFSVKHGPAIDMRVYKMTANSNIKGTGTNYTSSVTCVIDPEAGATDVSLTNAAGVDVYVSLILTGRPIVDQPMQATVTNALTSETVFTLNNPFMQDWTHAQAYATMISNFLDEAQRTIEVQIEQLPAVQFNLDLFRKIDFTSAKLAIDGTYYAGMIEHRWNAETGQAVVTTLVMRPRLTDDTAIGNDEEDPDLPYIPEPTLPPGGWMPINTPTQPPTDVPVDPDDPGGCLSNVDAIANGPVQLLLYSSYLQSNTNTYLDLPLGGGLWTRPAGFTNPTKIAITGDWLKWNQSIAEWEGNIETDWWDVLMNSMYLTKGTYSDGGTGTRVLTVDLGGAQSISNIRIILNQGVWNYVDSFSDWVFGKAKPGTELGAAVAEGNQAGNTLNIVCGPGWEQGSWSYEPPYTWTIGTSSTINITVSVPGNSFTSAYVDYSDTIGGPTVGSIEVSLNTDFDLSAYDGKHITKLWLNTVTYQNTISFESVVLSGIETEALDNLYRLNLRGVALYNVCSA